MTPVLQLLPIVSQPARRAAHAPSRAARNAAASDALKHGILIQNGTRGHGGFRDRLLMVLLSDARHVVVASSNALVSGAARDFHDQRNGAGRNECRFPAVAVDLFLAGVVDEPCSRKMS
jgi:hypothetical protein